VMVVGPEADPSVQHVFMTNDTDKVKILDVFGPEVSSDRAEKSGHLIRVNMLRVLTNPDYFLTCIAEAEAKFEKDITDRKNKSMGSSAVKVDYSKLTTTEYLEKTG
jgi:hypothetical protein